jgi:hypothetical protein
MTRILTLTLALVGAALAGGCQKSPAAAASPEGEPVTPIPASAPVQASPEASAPKALETATFALG